MMRNQFHTNNHEVLFPNGTVHVTLNDKDDAVALANMLNLNLNDNLTNKKVNPTCMLMGVGWGVS